VGKRHFCIKIAVFRISIESYLTFNMLIFIPAKLQKVTHTYINYTCKLTQTIDVIVSQMKVNRSRPVSKYIFILLLANAFYTETNPGPRAPKWHLSL
jgi:hypothetical protein